jgi:hypothetical protein
VFQQTPQPETRPETQRRSVTFILCRLHVLPTNKPRKKHSVSRFTSLTSRSLKQSDTIDLCVQLCQPNASQPERGNLCGPTGQDQAGPMQRNCSGRAAHLKGGRNPFRFGELIRPLQLSSNNQLSCVFLFSLHIPVRLPCSPSHATIPASVSLLPGRAIFSPQRQPQMQCHSIQGQHTAGIPLIQPYRANALAN